MPFTKSSLWATETPTAYKVPISGADGKLAYAWLPTPVPNAGVVSQPSVTKNTDGTIVIGNDGLYALRTTTSMPEWVKLYNINGGTFSLNNLVPTYIVARYNGGTPDIVATENRLDVDGNFLTVIPITTVVREGTEIHEMNLDSSGASMVEKHSNFLLNNERFTRDGFTGGLNIGETAGSIVTVSDGKVWFGGEQAFTLASFASNVNGFWLYVWNGSAWVKNARTTYDNFYYQGASALVELTNNHYAVNWIFRTVGDDVHCFSVLGTGNYSLVEASASQVPNIPDLFKIHSVLVGRIIVKKGDVVATQIDSAFAKNFSPSGVTLHNALTGLQGGTTDEYYHLTAAQYSGLTAGNYLPIVQINTPTTLDGTHAVVEVTNGSTITLPTAVGVAGRTYNIIRSGTADVLINTTGGQTISGQSSLTLIIQWASVVLISNGSNWLISS